MKDKAYRAQASIPVLKERLYDLLERTALAMVNVCNVDHELKDMMRFGTTGGQLQQRCDELIKSVADLGGISSRLEFHATELVEQLGWEVEWDENRAEWYVIDDGGNEEEEEE
jgi:hypothetical protein